MTRLTAGYRPESMKSHGLSSRALQWAAVGYSRGAVNHYHPHTNPLGIIPMGTSDNWLIKDLLCDFLNNQITFDAAHFSYNEGFTGTEALSKATAALFDRYFMPKLPCSPENFTFVAGATSLNELCATLLCDSDRGQCLLLPAPNYGAFNRDFTMRTGIGLEHAYFDPETVDQFTTDCIKGLESALDNALVRGKVVKGVVICNPSNPLGQCYTRDALVGILKICERRRLHLISDEIYALSVYKPTSGRQAEQFCSVLSADVDLACHIDPDRVHVLYGFAKDFGSPGLRLGCLYSSNAVLSAALRACCRFASPSQLSMHVVASILADESFLADLLKQSQARLGIARARTEKMLDRVGIPYHSKGNAGLFLWLDLSSFLKTDRFAGDAWAAHRDLGKAFDHRGVDLSDGETYHSPTPGCFRMVFSVPDYSIDEGIRRMAEILETRMSSM